MNREQIQIGETYTYFPPKKHADDNLHYPVKVVGFTKKMVRVEDGTKKRSVPFYRLEPQLELI